MLKLLNPIPSQHWAVFPLKNPRELPRSLRQMHKACMPQRVAFQAAFVIASRFIGFVSIEVGTGKKFVLPWMTAEMGESRGWNVSDRELIWSILSTSQTSCGVRPI